MAAMTNMERDVAAQRLRAELVLQGVLELRQMRGRLTRVTVDDVALLLAMVDRAGADDHEYHRKQRLMLDGSPCWCVSDEAPHAGWFHAPVCVGLRNRARAEAST